MRITETQPTFKVIPVDPVKHTPKYRENNFINFNSFPFMPYDKETDSYVLDFENNLLTAMEKQAKENEETEKSKEEDRFKDLLTQARNIEYSRGGANMGEKGRE